MITSGIQGTAVTAFKVNGVRKTIAGPVTGVLLHSVAGFPNKLTGGGKTVEKTNEPFDVQPDTDFTAEYGDGSGLDTPHAVETDKKKPEPITESQIVAPAKPAPVTDKK